MKRVVARLRSRAPFLGLLFPLVLGQTLTSFVPEGYLPQAYTHLILLAVVGAVCLLARSAGVVIFLLGIASALPTKPSLQKAHRWTEDTSYIATVQEPLRFRRVGRVELSLQALGSLSTRGTERNRTLSFDSWESPEPLVCAAVHLPWKNVEHVRAGSLIIFRAKFQVTRANYNPLSYESNLIRKGIRTRCKIRFLGILGGREASWLQKLRIGLLRHVESVLGTGERSGLFLSLAFGMRDRLSDETERAFKQTSLAHLLVFSGFQLSVVFFAILKLVRKFFSRCRYFHAWVALRLLASALAALFVLGVFLFVGQEPSVTRAFIAVMIFVVSFSCERGSGPAHTVSACLLLLLLLWPGCIFEPGPQLTFAALSGILLGVLAPARSRAQRYLKVSLFASLSTAVVSLLWFDVFSLAGILLNPIVAPVISVLSCNLGYLAVAFSLAGLSSLPLELIAGLLSQFSDFVSEVAAISALSFELTGISKSCLASVLLVMLCRSWMGRLREFQQRENLWAVRSR